MRGQLIARAATRVRGTRASASTVQSSIAARADQPVIKSARAGHSNGVLVLVQSSIAARAGQPVIKSTRAGHSNVV